MKALIFWSVTILGSLGLYFVLHKTSAITTYFDQRVSPISCDIAIILICGYTALVRIISVFGKLFK